MKSATAWCILGERWDMKCSCWLQWRCCWQVLLQEPLRQRMSRTLKQSQLSNVASNLTPATPRLSWPSLSATPTSPTKYDPIWRRKKEIHNWLTGSGLRGTCRLAKAAAELQQPRSKVAWQLQLGLLIHVQGERPKLCCFCESKIFLLKELHESTTSAYIAAARQGQGKGIDPDIQADNWYLILILMLIFNWLLLKAIWHNSWF